MGRWRRTVIIPLKVGLSLRSRTGQQTTRQQSSTGDGGNLLDRHKALHIR
jgi:hypothetical protein